MNDLRQFLHIVRYGMMAAVAVCGFHDHIIGSLYIGRIVDDRLVQVADVTGKHHLLCNFFFSQPDLDAGRSQQMSRIDKPHFDAGRRRVPFPVRQTDKQFDRTDGIIHGIQRHKFFFSGPFAFPVAPLCFKLLNMRTVTQHDAAEIICGKRGVDRPPESVRIQLRKQPGMIDMGMCQKDKVQL